MKIEMNLPFGGEPEKRADVDASESSGLVIPDVLDVCCGTRMMWMDKEDSRVVFVDRRAESFSIAPGRAYKHGAELIVAPDKVADFTALPFEDATFSHVVFDPPHHTTKRLGKTGTGVMEKKYGRLGDDWREMLAGGFAECFRVLKPKGTLIFKWHDTEIPLREVLETTQENHYMATRAAKKPGRTGWPS